MKVYHQTGHIEKWNIECYHEGIGDGLIFSPVNIDAEKLLNLNPKLKVNSFLDPQLYLLNELKGTLNTYPYFPGNLKSDFSTPDLDNSHIELAKLCVDFQLENDFIYIVIPIRYFSDNPTKYFIDSDDLFVNPYCDYIREKNITKKVLLTVIIKGGMLIDEEKRAEVLNWITGHQTIDGVYLIFENNFSTKQIKDFDYLINVLRFIKVLKDNELEVHIGYNNNEGFLYSVAMPDSVSVGSYENLRSFGIKRFKETDNGQMRSPNARLYSGKLLQWIDYGYVQSMKELVDNYENYFEESKFTPLNFKSETNWQFKRTEPYKHYFCIFTNQIKNLPMNQNERIIFVKEHIKNAILLFKQISDSDVLLDENSDGSHLATWYNVLSVFNKEITK
jgi:hypothetical protein